MNVIDILTGCGAMLNGHFLLSSGNHSPVYFQCARLLQFPEKAAAVLALPCAALAEAKKEGRLGFDAAVGPAMGGVIVAYEAARQLGIPALFTERDDSGAFCLRRGFEVPRGSRVIITEDVITTGKSTLETARVLEDAGAVVVASLCVVDRRPRGAPSPFTWEIFSALRQSAVIYSPDSCPLCAQLRAGAALPLVKPGSRKDPRAGRPNAPLYTQATGG
jgi:orotate phosphoribosyltransferase